jgi:hypothetical protein
LRANFDHLSNPVFLWRAPAPPVIILQIGNRYAVGRMECVHLFRANRFYKSETATRQGAWD